MWAPFKGNAPFKGKHGRHDGGTYREKELATNYSNRNPNSDL